MTTPLRFGRYHDIAVEIAGRFAERRGDDSLARWDVEVIAASSGMARAIAGEVVARCGGVAAVEIRTLESFARAVVNDAGEFPRVATESEQRLAMRTAVRSIEHPILDTRGIAAMLLRTYRDVRDGGLTLDLFRRRVAAARNLRDAQRTALIIRVWGAYERFIAAMGADDPADLLNRAAALVRQGAAVGEQLVAGFYDVTDVQRNLIAALQERGRIGGIWVPADSGESYRFAQRFVSAIAPATPVETDPSLRSRTPQCEIREHYTRGIEIDSICAAVSQLLANGVAPSSIGITTRALDPYDADLLDRAARRNGFRVADDFEIPLTAHPIGRGLVQLLRLDERGFPRGDVLEILRSGLRTRSRIDIDRADRETRQARIAGGPRDRLRLVRNASYAVVDYIAVVAEVEEMAPPAASLWTGNEWAGFLRSTVDRFQLRSDADLLAVEQVDAVADLFGIAAATNARFDAAAVIDALEQATIPMDRPSDLPLVWLGDVMRFRGRTFEHLFVFAMQEDSFPQRRIEDPLLPDSDRRQLAIREIGNGDDEEQLLFRILFDGARASLRFSFAGSDGFGRLLRPSQLLKMSFASAAAWLRGSETAPRLRSPAASQLRQLQLLVRSGTSGVFDGYLTNPALRTRAAALLEQISPTQLEDFGECPQKFFLKHLLGVREIDDPDRELQIHHREKGSIDHTILERFYRALTPDELAMAAGELPRLPSTLAARLEDEVDAAFDEFEQTAPPFNPPLREMERRATKRILRDFVAADIADLVENGLRPREFEYCFGAKYRDRGAHHPEPFLIAAAETTLRVEGRVDRIDAGDGKLRVIDYKSGKANRHRELAKKIDRGVRLQLALYSMAVAKFFGVDAASVSGAIKALVIGGKPAQFAFALGEKEGRLRDTLTLFARAIARGLFPAFPNDDDNDINSCKYCPARNACRTKHDADERYAVTRSEDPRTLLEGLL